MCAFEAGRVPTTKPPAGRERRSRARYGCRGRVGQWARRNALFEAARRGTTSEVKAALSAGADPGARAGYGATPLHWAAVRCSNLSVIKALIEAGANPGARDDDGKVPCAMRGVLNEAGKMSEDERKKFGGEYSCWPFGPLSLWEAIILGAVILALVVALGMAYFS